MKRLLLLALLLSGCVTMADVERQRREEQAARMQQLVGGDIHDLVSAWGPPVSVTPNGPTTIYAWEWHGPTTASFLYGYGSIRTHVCSVWFDVSREGLVLAWHERGC